MRSQAGAWERATRGKSVNWRMKDAIKGILHMRTKVVYTFDERYFGQTCSVSQSACAFFMRML